MIKTVRVLGRAVCLLAGLSASLPAVAAAELVVGVFPRRDATETIRMFTPLVKHLSQALGREVKLETAKDFDAFWRGVVERRYDLVHYNQYDYVKSHMQHGYQVIAKNVEFGDATIAGALVVRTDSGINALADLKGKKIVFGGGPTAYLAYVTNTHLLRKAGLKHGDYIEEFSKSPPNAVLATFYGQASAGGAGNGALELPSVKNKIDVSQLKYLAVGEKHANLPWAVKADMPRELRERIQATLTGLGSSPAGREVLSKAVVTAFVPATDAEYDLARRLIFEVLNEKY
jgi:phosphonate transport system substrate-binding protein